MAQWYKLSPEAIAALTGRTIVRVDSNALHLDNGKAIYLDENEIESLNDHYDTSERIEYSSVDTEERVFRAMAGGTDGG